MLVLSLSAIDQPLGHAAPSRNDVAQGGVINGPCRRTTEERKLTLRRQ